MIGYGEVAQLARARGSYPRCRGFKSPPRYYFFAPIRVCVPGLLQYNGNSPVTAKAVAENEEMRDAVQKTKDYLSYTIYGTL